MTEKWIRTSVHGGAAAGRVLKLNCVINLTAIECIQDDGVGGTLVYLRGGSVVTSLDSFDYFDCALKSL